MSTGMSSEAVVKGVVASAGAKVMITGGYLVLENPNTGLVLSVDSRLHTGVYSLSSSSTSPQSNFDGSITLPIYISTPQRSTNYLLFSLTLKKSSEISPANTSPFYIELTGDVDQNPFVSKTLHYCLIAISAVIIPEEFVSRLGSGLLIHIRGDRPFYSSTPISTSPSVPEVVNGVTLEPEYHDNPEDYRTKTGLGSSAAVVSSFTAAIYAFFSLWPSTDDSSTYLPEETFTIPLSPENSRLFAYRVAQLAHCAAQGKVGSGFDVSAAFYGTQTYCRFSSHLIQPLLDHQLETTTIMLNQQQPCGSTPHPHPYSSPSDSTRVVESLLPGVCDWDDVISAFHLPRGLKLLLGDVQGGSETPSMVKMILQWKKNMLEDIAKGKRKDNLWELLGNANKQVEADFEMIRKLAIEYPTHFDQAIAICMNLPSAQWFSSSSDETVTQVAHALVKLHDDFAVVREYLRQMGTEADVPVEPSSQTKLLDNTSAIDGVIFAGCPGAGGYDAVFAVVLDDGSGSACKKVLDWWSTQKAPKEDDVDEDDDDDGSGIKRLPVDIDTVNGVQVRISSRMFQL